MFAFNTQVRNGRGSSNTPLGGGWIHHSHHSSSLQAKFERENGQTCVEQASVTRPDVFRANCFYFRKYSQRYWLSTTECKVCQLARPIWPLGKSDLYDFKPPSVHNYQHRRSKMGYFGRYYLPVHIIKHSPFSNLQGVKCEDFELDFERL